jgi:predicted DNA-binding transcriptional regulator YafY
MKRKQMVSRAIRLVHIRDLLREGPRTITELADLCEVTPSTIYRDIADLQSEPLWEPLMINVVWVMPKT